MPGRFQEALGGLLVEDWRADADRARDAAERTRLRAEELAAGLGEEQLRLASLETEYQKMEHRLKEAREEASRTAGQLEQIDATSVDVASAEAQVQEGRNRVGSGAAPPRNFGDHQRAFASSSRPSPSALGPSIEGTHDRVDPGHHPGRYVDALVDPETLEVTLQTADGGRHEAVLLSHGTAEQVYLLLRMILAQVLTNKHERCPVLLDDPTVHADVDRKKEVLEYLLQASESHQVILFTQDELVVRWARRRADREKIRLIQLAAPLSV